MMPQLGHLGPFTVWTYTALLDAAILLTLAALAWQGWRSERRPNAWLDVGLAALLGGVVGARIVHVAIYRAYFSEHIGEIVRFWQGGLDWHGAVGGGLVTLIAACRWRRVDWRQVTDVLAFALPIGAALTFTGCLMDSCGYGREVASLAGYPPLVVAELPDLYGLVAPRLTSQLYGTVLSLLLLPVVWLLPRLIRRSGVRFWIGLGLLGLGVFGIGYTRGDAMPMVGPLRLDQALDLMLAAVSIIVALIAAWPRRPIAEPAPAGGQPEVTGQGAEEGCI